MIFAINGKQIYVQGIRELKPGLSIEKACQMTKNNGLDEVYFTSNNKSYVAYGDKLNISDLKKREIPIATFNGQKADIVSFDDELNTIGEGIVKGTTNALKQTGESVIGTVKNIIGSIGPTGVLVAGGTVVGLTICSMIKQGTISASLGSTLSSTGIIGSALGAGVMNAIKLAGIAGAVGLGITGIAGAFSGAMEALNKEKNYQTIAAVTKDGNIDSTSTNDVETTNLNLINNNLPQVYNNYNKGFTLLSPQQLLLTQ